MRWNFIDDDEVRVPRSIRAAVVEEEPQQNKDLATEWPRVTVVLMKVLSRFPEAREAFVKAIQELFQSKREPVPQWAT